MRRIGSILMVVGAVAACNGGDAPDEPAATATATPTPTPTSGTTLNGARAVAEQTDDFLFEYSYPAAAGTIPELATLLDLWLAQRREELARDSGEARREARGEGFPYNKHSYTAEWKVVAELPDWLSLSNAITTYSGGAHGNYTVESLVWDRDREEAMDAIELFASPAELEEAVGTEFCAALDRERARRRADAAAEDEGEEEGEGESAFDDCPGMDELEVLVGSSNGRTFNRLTLYAGPYVAGPYAEGAYSIDLPVTRAVLASVKPDYAEAFSARN